VAAEPDAVRAAIGVTGQFSAVDNLLTGRENLKLMADLNHLGRTDGKRKIEELLAQFDLADAGRRRVATWSGGMRRRLDLAASLVVRPAVLFLDEPTTGLDLRGRQAMWQVVGGLAGSGVTVFLTTQYLEEADRLADRIAVVDRGRVVAEGTSAELKQRVAGQRLDLTLAGAWAFEEVARSLGERAVRADRARLTVGVATDGSAAHVRALLDEVDPRRRAVARFAVHTATLDDVFLTLTGRPAEAPEHEPEHEKEPASVA
jgi:ABC-2 type transport system ATP-binding protein